MALWVCNRCSCEFAVGLRMCPQCTAEDCHEKGDEEMAKISKANGPTYKEGEAGWDGTSSSTSSEPDGTSTTSSSLPDQSPAQTTANPSTSPQTDQGSSAPSTDGASATSPVSADQPDPYDGWTKEDLQAELADRELPVSGNKPELLERLRENDAEKADPDAPTE